MLKNTIYPTIITKDKNNKWVRITHKIDPDRTYSKKELGEFIEKLQEIYSQLEVY